MSLQNAHTTKFQIIIAHLIMHIRHSQTRLILICCLLGLILSSLTAYSQTPTPAQAAEAVINRFTQGQVAVSVSIKTDSNYPYFSYFSSHDTIFIQANSPVAACRGFYQWTKSKHAGICSWSGNHFVRPTDLTTPLTTAASPFLHHQYFNVVTYGYTMPYWDTTRWNEELDWMALHGIDQPLMLLAQEAVFREVFLNMGLTDDELDAWEVGPAHLPWMRMGNISGNSFDGPLGKEWHQQQLQLAQFVITRMRQLGMTPICPAFSGFVPPALAKHYNIQLDTTGWDWVPSQCRNYRIRPDSPLFSEIGTRFIQCWERHFGKNTYYLSDSFNEMAIPTDTAIMSLYGQAIYNSICHANPDAIWVMQGWTLGYQRSQWGNGIFEALTRHVPQGKFYLLDMATDYNCCFWKNSFNWDYYHAFNGQPWAWSVIPNMGGKTCYTGVLDHYANGRLQAFSSPNRGQLLGYGMAPEGLENNELIYELLCDGGYLPEDSVIDVDQWLEDYVHCRYGFPVTSLTKLCKDLYNSAYSNFRDHPQFGWQVRNNITGHGATGLDSTFYRNAEQLCRFIWGLPEIYYALDSAATAMYLADYIEIASLYIAGKIEDINDRILDYTQRGLPSLALQKLDTLEAIMLDLDSLLSFHPLHRLDRWEYELAFGNSDTKHQQRNAINARRLVSVWYGDHQQDEPVNDYSCRLWSGLIRDYYLPRLLGTWHQIIEGIEFDQIAFENAFVNAATTTHNNSCLSDNRADKLKFFHFVHKLMERAKLNCDLLP